LDIRTQAGIFLIVWSILFVLVDVYARIFGGKEATFSYLISEFSQNNQAVPFVLGFIMGHIFWRM
jgi:hypothetical protein